MAFGETVETPDGKKNIEELKIGDLILGTNNEYRTVIEVTEPDEQECYEITTASGKTIVCSGKQIFICI